MTTTNTAALADAEFAERVQKNQAKLRAELNKRYDFIVCGSGSSGSVVARRLAEHAGVSVLLLEAGGHDAVPEVMEAASWPANLRSERVWDFHGEPASSLNGRSLPLAMGRVLGGGSSVNVMIWARGHSTDWEYFAEETGDPSWNYESVLQIYRRIEDWHGAPDPEHRGTGGPVYVEPAPAPHPIARAVLEATRTAGIRTFGNQNGKLMESEAGASIIDLRTRDGKRQSVFRSYVYPIMDASNLTVLTHALVTRLTFDGKRVTGVDVAHQGGIRHIEAGSEVILSLGAIHTPKVLMQSGLGDYGELRALGIPVVQHLPGVGRNYQDHVGFDCNWESREAMIPRNTAVEATFFARSDSAMSAPDLQTLHGEFLKASPENLARFALPASGWGFFGMIVRPKSRGRLRLTGPKPRDAIQIETNYLSHPDDLAAARRSVQIGREIGNSAPLRPFVRREVAPGNLKGADLDAFIRDAAMTSWHQSGTAKMGRDSDAVVNGALQVYGIECLRIADASVMPRVTTGNTMAPCVIIGERAAEVLRGRYRL